MKECDLCKKEKDDVITYRIGNETISVCEKCKILSAVMNYDGIQKADEYMKDRGLDDKQKQVINSQVQLMKNIYENPEGLNIIVINDDTDE